MAFAYGNIASAIALVVLIQCLWTVFYRLYLHPLAKFPGPFWARISAWPSYQWTKKQDRHVWLYRLHAEYGSVVRYRPDAVAFNTVEAYKTIFGTSSNFDKIPSFYRIWPHRSDLVNTWNVVDPALHSRKRRTLANAFSDRALREAEPLIQQNIDRWIEIIGQSTGADGQWSTSYNMADQANYLIFDILGDLCFGKSFDMKEPESEIRHIPHLIMSFVQFLHPLGWSPYAPLWLWLKPRGLDWLLSYTIPQALKDWQKFVEQCLNDRTEKEENLTQSEVSRDTHRKDFFHHLFAAKDPETGKPSYTVGELFNECELLTIAGSDTTSIMLAGMVFYLVKLPLVQEKLAREISTTFDTASDIVAGPALQQCKYLRAVISEALRINPPVPSELARQVASGGTTVADHFFPSDTKVSASLYCVNLNEKSYPDPFQFRPGRYLVKTKEDPEGSSEEEVAAADAGLASFSMGPRGCIGKNLAWLEMQLVLAKIIHAYEIRQVDQNNLGGGHPDLPLGHRDPNVYQLYDAFVAVRDGPMIQFRKRTRP